MCSLGNRFTWEIFGNVVYLHQYENGEDSPEGDNSESCLKAFHKCRQNMLVQNQQFSARVRRVIGGRWSRWSFRAGVRRGIKLLSKERRNVVNEESGYENSGKKILCCRNVSAFGKFILLHSSFASSCTGVSHTETIVLSPKQPVAKRQLCILARPKSPLILSWSTELRFCQKEVQESQWYPVYFCVDLWNV